MAARRECCPALLGRRLQLGAGSPLCRSAFNVHSAPTCFDHLVFGRRFAAAWTSQNKREFLESVSQKLGIREVWDTLVFR